MISAAPYRFRFAVAIHAPLPDHRDSLAPGGSVSGRQVNRSSVNGMRRRRFRIPCGDYLLAGFERLLNAYDRDLPKPERLVG